MSRILVAEDERISRRSLERRLLQWGHEVVAVQDGEEAWTEWQESDFDLLITDWDMPCVDGLELVRRIRTSKRSFYSYIIMLTARSATEDLVVGMEAGADDFLSKPFDKNELRVRCRAGERIVDLERSLAGRNQELSEAMRRLEGAQSELVHAERMAVLGKLAAGVSHELNTPLGVIRSGQVTLGRIVERIQEALSRDLSSEELRTDRKLSRALSVLESVDSDSSAACARISKIVSSLQQFAGLDEAEIKQVDLNNAIDCTLDLLQHELGPETQIHRTFGNIPKVVNNPGEINLTLMTLLTFSNSSLEGPGRISIETTCDSGMVAVRISDSGKGIPSDQIGELSQPNFSVSNTRVSADMGLASAYNAAHRMGGKLSITSVTGKGTEYELRLPLTKAASGARAEV